jgi:hypothetical protein
MVFRAIYHSLLNYLPETASMPIRRAVGRTSRVFKRSPKPPAPVTQQSTPFGFDARLMARLQFAGNYYRDLPAEILNWARHSREDSNFSYDITDRSKDYLAAMVSVVTGAPTEQVKQYFLEPAHDLADYIPPLAANLAIDQPLNFGRRLGWYAIARAMKPRVIIETGVMHGIGAALLCSALRRNAREGAAGRYYGTDIDASAGVLLVPPLTEFGTILHGDSIASLQRFTEKIDLFVNDSDHSDDYERREYQTIKDKLSDRAVILGDNSHVTDALLRFANETERQFLFFRETPKDHWYPGSGIGIAFRLAARNYSSN